MARLPRSILVIPGHRADWIAKARANNNYGAGQLLLDLEDGVSAEKKEEARDTVARLAGPGDAVRVNAGSSADAAAFCERSEITVWVPKVATSGDALAAGLFAHPVLLIESPLAIVSLPSLLFYIGDLAGIAFGRHDYMASAGLTPFQAAALDHAAAQVALAAMARGVPCWDAPSFALDSATLQLDAWHSRNLGFSGKGCIHPSQVPIVDLNMSPATAERGWAKGVLGVDGVRTNDWVGEPTRAAARRVLG